MKAKINGTEIYFDVEGMQLRVEDGKLVEKPVCFILHGGPGMDHTDYLPNCTPLSEYMQLVYIDNRGSGRSGRPDITTCNVEQNIEDIEALRQYLGLDKIVLFGHSYGGITAQGYAVKYPQNLAGLILLGTTPTYKAMVDGKAELLARGTEEQIEYGRHLFDGTFENDEHYKVYFEKLCTLYSHKRTSSAGVKEAVEYMIVSSDVINYATRNDWYGFDWTEGLKKIDVPTLVVGGAHDWITPVKYSYQIADAIKGSELIIYEDSGHSLFYDAGDRMIPAIIQFIKKALL